MVQAATEKAISVLYLFAGRPRQGDMTDCLQQLANGYKIRMTCVDIQRKPSLDLASCKEREAASESPSQGVQRNTAIATLLYLVAGTVG